MRRDNDVGAAAGDLKLIDQQVSNLARLVDDLLDVTRMRQGKINLLKVPIDLRTVVDQRFSRSSRCGFERAHAVGGTARNMCRRWDAARLEQAVVNLLDNAMKYTDTGGRIGVALTADPAQAVLRVQDTGIGIRPEMLPCISTFLPGRKLADTLAWRPRNRVVHGGEARRDARRRCRGSQ